MALVKNTTDTQGVLQRLFRGGKHSSRVWSFDMLLSVFLCCSFKQNKTTKFIAGRQTIFNTGSGSEFFLQHHLLVSSYSEGIWIISSHLKDSRKSSLEMWWCRLPLILKLERSTLCSSNCSEKWTSVLHSYYLLLARKVEIAACPTMKTLNLSKIVWAKMFCMCCQRQNIQGKNGNLTWTATGKFQNNTC